MRLPRLLYVLLIVLVAACGSISSAQAQDQEQPSLVGGSVKGTLLDPSTYAPSVLQYESMLLDWKSSQPFFRNGFVEENPRYTVNGLVHDVPVSYEVGKRRILKDSLAVLPMMLANNAASNLIERSLIRRYPEHRKLLRTLGWIQRISLSSYVSYQLSASHFRQWQRNQQAARQLGYR